MPWFKRSRKHTNQYDVENKTLLEQVLNEILTDIHGSFDEVAALKAQVGGLLRTVGGLGNAPPSKPPAVPNTTVPGVLPPSASPPPPVPIIPGAGNPDGGSGVGGGSGGGGADGNGGGVTPPQQPPPGGGHNNLNHKDLGLYTGGLTTIPYSVQGSLGQLSEPQRPALPMLQRTTSGGAVYSPLPSFDPSIGLRRQGELASNLYGDNNISTMVPGGNNAIYRFYNKVWRKLTAILDRSTLATRLTTFPANNYDLGSLLLVNSVGGTSAAITYVCETTGTANYWKYQSGIHYDSVSSKPTLTANDAGYLFYDLTNLVLLRWSGTVWLRAADSIGSLAGTYQHFLIQFSNNAGTIYHKTTSDPIAGTASTQAFKVTGFSSTYNATPTVNAATGFTTGVGLTAGALDSFLLDTATQTTNGMLPGAVVVYNDTGGAAFPLAISTQLNSDINGTTRTRPRFRMYVPGGVWNINAANIPAGTSIAILIWGYIE